jgi:hypothetical protein
VRDHVLAAVQGLGLDQGQEALDPGQGQDLEEVGYHFHNKLSTNISFFLFKNLKLRRGVLSWTLMKKAPQLTRRKNALEL